MSRTGESSMYTYKSTVLLAGVVSLLGTGGQQLLAQESDSDDEPLENIVVTGSRLVRPGASAPIPVTSVSAEEIELSGATLISDYIGELPVFGINSGRMTEVSNALNTSPLPTVGTERLNLRDLGEQRTLVVVDGRRHIGSVAGATSVDVGSIPTALIERVEISTGGASVAYGADAIAGVVNFIMKKDFEGLQIDARYGDSDQGGGESEYFTLTAGGNFADGRGNAVVSATYNSLGGIEGHQRDWLLRRTAFVGNAADTGPNDGIPAEILADGTRLTNLFTQRNPTLLGLVTGQTIILADDGQSWRPFIPGSTPTGSVGFTVGGDGLDIIGLTNVATPLEGRSFLGRVNYAFADNVNFFMEGKYYGVDASVIGVPLFDAVAFFDSGGLFIPDPANPFLPQGDPLFDQVVAENFGLHTLSRWHDDFDAKGAEVSRDTFRIVTGIEGEIGRTGWNYDLFLQYGDTSERYTEFNNRDPRRFLLATDAVVDVNGVTGVAPGSPACRATVDAALAGGTTDRDILECRPVNLFGRGLASRESLDYFLIDLLTNRGLEQVVVGGSLTGDWFELPAGPVSFAAGFEYRDEQSEVQPDNAQVTGQTFHGEVLPLSGSYDVIEAYVEARLPLLQEKPFAHLLAVEGGFRASDYSTTGSTSAWRFGVDWAPVSQLRFRAMYAEAVRAPNISELFTPLTRGIAVVSDPCDKDRVGLGPDPTRRLANCTTDLARFGLDPLTFDSNDVLTPQLLSGGNANLNEEESTSLTYGFVYTPAFLDNRLTVTVDYFDIEIEGVITSSDPTEFIGLPAQVVNDCYDRFDTIDNQFCVLISRNDTPGPLLAEIQLVTVTTLNLDTLSTSGIDFEINYGFAIKRWLSGDFRARLLASYMDSFEVLPLANAANANEFVGSPSKPDWRGQIQLMYYTDSYTLSYLLRYVDGVRFSAVADLNPIEGSDPSGVGSETFSDIHFAYNFGSQGETHRYQIYTGLNNVFDAEPPPGIRFGRNTEGSPYYDPIGRYWYVGIRARF